MLTNILINRINKYSTKHSTLYMLGLMLFFFALFDGSYSYMVPIVITNSGFSKTAMGLIYTSSSIFGALFDLVLSRYMKNIHYRRVYLIMIGLCFICPALLVKGYSIWFFLSAMAFWGFYFDLCNFGNLDFVSRKTSPSEHSQSFGILSVFKGLGYTIAPLLIGALIGEAITIVPYIFMYIVLCLVAALIFILIYITKKQKLEFIHEQPRKKINIFAEAVIWKKIGRILLPVLSLTMFLWVYDAFFWTIGPLLNSTFSSIPDVGGLFLTLYEIPTLIMGFLVGNVNNRLGKKRTAQYSSLIACAFLSCFFLVHSAIILLGLAMFASIFIAFSIPSLNGAYADYIYETPAYEKEIEALQDFFTNIGFIIGPVLAGFLADKVGNLNSFGYLGIIGFIITIYIIIITPRHIKVKI